MPAESTGSFTRNFLILFTGNSIGQVIPFLLAPFITRLFSPSEIAVQENFLAMASLIAIVAGGRFDLAILLPKQDQKARQLFSLAFQITIVVALFSLISILFKEEIAQFYKTPALDQFIWFLAPSIFLLSALSIFTQWILRLKNYKLITGTRILQSLVQNGGYVVLGYLGWGIAGLFWAWVLGLLLPVIWMFLKSSLKLDQLKFPKQELKETIKEYKDFPMVNSLHAFTDILATQFLLYWLITRNYGALALGLFAIMNRYLRAPLNLVGSAVGQLYYREAGNVHGNATDQLAIFYRSLRLISLFTVPALVLILVAGPSIFGLYLGDEWREAGALAQIMAPAILFNFLASVVSTTPLIHARQKRAYSYGLTGHVLSLGVLIVGSFIQSDFHEILYVYSGVLSVYYIGLLFWYRNLIIHSVA